MQGVLPLSNQKSSQTVVDMFTDCAQTALELVKYQHIICQLFAPDGSSLELLQLFWQAAAMDKLHNLRWDALKEDVLVWCVTHQPFHAWQQPVPSRLTTTPAGQAYSTIWYTRSEPPTGAGSQAVVESTLPRPGHVLHQWPRDLHELTPLYEQQAHTTLRTASSHHSTNSKLTPFYTSELTPLYEQQAHTILRLANSHHSTNNDHTPLYKQRAHTTLQPVSSHHSTTSELTPLYEQRAHTTLRPVKLTPPASSHHSTNEHTPLYKQRAHTTLRPVSSHHSMNSELTPLYDQ
ncbi:hypothetical protein EMCRGX_G018433 [Ephydatia muelleri]